MMTKEQLETVEDVLIWVLDTADTCKDLNELVDAAAEAIRNLDEFDNNDDWIRF